MQVKAFDRLNQLYLIFKLHVAKMPTFEKKISMRLRVASTARVPYKVAGLGGCTCTPQFF